MADLLFAIGSPFVGVSGRQRQVEDGHFLAGERVPAIGRIGP
jgi:hypothetical protein